MRVLIIDIETTGLSHNYNQILTVGMILADIDMDSLIVIDTRHIKIRHKSYRVSGIALKINKINLDEHHQTGIDIKQACEEIDNFIKLHNLEDIPLIGHNIGFDIRFLRELYRNSNHDFPLDFEVIDTRSIWIGLRNKGIVPSHLRSSLRTLAEYFEVSYEGAHDALVDCYITMNAFHKLLGLVNLSK